MTITKDAVLLYVCAGAILTAITLVILTNKRREDNTERMDCEHCARLQRKLAEKRYITDDIYICERSSVGFDTPPAYCKYFKPKDVPKEAPEETPNFDKEYRRRMDPSYPPPWVYAPGPTCTVTETQTDADDGVYTKGGEK